MAMTPACKAFFSKKAVHRGDAYFRRGRVDVRRIEGDVAELAVAGSGPAPYNVAVDWSGADEGSLAAGCTCPNFAGGHWCKHIWAALRELEARHGGYLPPLDRRIEMIRCEVPDQQGEPFEQEAPEYEWERQRTPSRRGASRVAVGSWRKALEQVKSYPWSTDAAGEGDASRPEWEKEAWYVVNLAETVERGQVAVEVFERRRRRDGQWGQFCRAEAGTESLSEFCRAEDRQLVAMLLGSDPEMDWMGFATRWRPSLRSIQPVLQERFLAEMAATGRLAWRLDDTTPVSEARRLRWDDGPAWRFRLVAETDERNRCWRLRGWLVRDGEQAPLEEPVLLLRSGLVLFADRAARLDAADVFPWIVALRRDGPLTARFDERSELLASLATVPALPEMVLPDALRAEQVRGEPRGRLLIESPRSRGRASAKLLVRVRFQYGEEEFGLRDPRGAAYDAANHRIVRRSREGERRLLDQLVDLPLRALSRFADEDHDYVLAEEHLAETVQKLVPAGWVVDAEGVRLRRPGAMRLRVASRMDWFELDWEADFEGAAARLPDLLAALRKGERFVRLDDGSQGVLPEQWLAKYGRLAQLAEEKDGKLKFAACQGLLLDALLAEHEHVDTDEQFRAFRRRLQSFEGISPAEAPATFRGVLRPYQREGLGWFDFLREFRFGGCLADDMGLGKTVQVLALLEARRTRRLGPDEQRRPSIVVAPKSLIFNWMEEAARFTPQLRVLDYTGPARHARLEQGEPYDVLLTTYGTLRRDIPKLKEIPFDYAVLDEAQAIKNPSSQASKAARLIRADNRLALTGTPVENHLGELWALFEFLNPGMLGRWSAFAGLSRGNDDNESLELLAKALRPFLLRRTKQQVLADLPEKLEHTVYCELSPKERKKYNELRDYYRAALADCVKRVGLRRAKIHVLEALLRLRQAACHPALLDAGKAGESSAKLSALMDQLEEVLAEGHKAIVFSQFVTLLAVLRRKLNKAGIAYEYLDGKTSDRGARVKRFQESPDCRLFLISLKAGGHGLNLTAADYVFLLDPWWNPAVEAQAIDRTHRIGQTRPVFAYRLVAKDTVEDKILELQQRKRKLAEAIISADNSLIRNLTSEDLRLLLS